MYYIASGLLMVITLPLTAVMCRFRLRNGRRVSYGTVVASATIVAMFWFLCLFPLDISYNSYHDDQHLWDPDWLSSLLRESAFINIICMVPALAVVAYYQRRHFGGGTE